MRTPREHHHAEKGECTTDIARTIPKENNYLGCIVTFTNEHVMHHTQQCRKAKERVCLSVS